MNTPKKPYPALLKDALATEDGLQVAMPIVKKKTVFSPEKVCSYMAAVLTGSLVLVEEKPPVVLQGRAK